MRIRFGRAVSLACGMLAWQVLLSDGAGAQNPLIPNMVASDGISVYGTGEAVARPNWVEVDLEVSGKAELTGDALVKYRDARKRLTEALDKLGMKDLSTEERGVSISAGTSVDQQQRINQGMPPAPTKPQIDVTSSVRVRLKNIREMPADEVLKTVGMLLDVAQDAGVNVGLSPAEIQMRQRYGNDSNQSTTVRFVVADLAELREKAYEQAVADARDRASRLAKLNHVKLGSAVSVQEILVAGDAESAKASNMPYVVNLNLPAPAPEAAKEPRISSTTLTEIPIQVKLLVRFAIEAADPATAQK